MSETEGREETLVTVERADLALLLEDWLCPPSNELERDHEGLFAAFYRLAATLGMSHRASGPMETPQGEEPK